MNDERDRRDNRDDNNDDDLQELKRRRRRDNDDDGDDSRGRGRGHIRPNIGKFQIWFEFNNSTVTADYVTEGEFSAHDLERFVDGLISDDFRLYRKQTFRKQHRDSGGYNRYDQRGGRSGGRGRSYYED